MQNALPSGQEVWSAFSPGLPNGLGPNVQRRVSCPIIVAPRSGMGDSASSRMGENLANGGVGGSNAPKTSDSEPSEHSSVSIRLLNDGDKSEEVDLSALSDEELSRLEKDDPFLYYSIPTVRRRSYRFHAGDVNVIKTMVRSSSSSRRISLPAEVLANAEISRAQQFQVPIEEKGLRGSLIRRSSRLSTEAHPSLIGEEIMMEELEELDDDAMDEDLEDLERELGL